MDTRNCGCAEGEFCPACGFDEAERLAGKLRAAEAEINENHNFMTRKLRVTTEALEQIRSEVGTSTLAWRISNDALEKISTKK